MKINILIVLLTISNFFCLHAFSCSLRGQDSREGELAHHKCLFETITKKVASPENILEILAKSHIESSRESHAVGLAVKIYSLSSDDEPFKKHELILNCAKNNPNSADILYDCATALEPSKESLAIYEKIVQNSEFSSIYRCLSAGCLFKHDLFPDSILNTIVAGAASSNTNEKIFVYQLYNSLKYMPSKKAAKLVKKIDAALKKKGISILPLVPKDIYWHEK